MSGWRILDAVVQGFFDCKVFPVREGHQIVGVLSMALY